jgi:hypothetical protein
MTAQVQATPGDLVLPDRTYPVVTASTSFWAVSWIWVLIVVLVALGAGWWWRRRRVAGAVADPEPEKSLTAV